MDSVDTTLPTTRSPDVQVDGVRRRVESYGLSHTGHVRPANEDHFVVASLQRSVEVRQTNLDDRSIFDRLHGPQAYLFAVADGVGGAAGGKLASGLTVETIVGYLSETVGSYHAVAPGQEHAFLDPLSHAVQRAHEKLLKTFLTQARGGPATTLTMALLVWPRAFVVHVGDSRAYLVRGDEMRRITRDQTMGAFLVEQKAISEQQAEKSGLNHVLSSAIGSADLTPAVSVVDLDAGDTILLCTDGLTNDMADADIASTLAAHADPEAACRALVDAALAGGGKDNITAIVVRTLMG